jgi:hypothetical protein
MCMAGMAAQCTEHPMGGHSLLNSVCICSAVQEWLWSGQQRQMRGGMVDVPEPSRAANEVVRQPADATISSIDVAYELSSMIMDRKMQPLVLSAALCAV